ncbi:hypothetical protein [Aquimarina algiphila]|uniref:hypothetical protein n=1 Tax=Aquimarina algiphila TaxID=2047982 RepID=UPI002492B63F|nr:hypothetical protein [Aquimarina algiphila]
MNNTSFIKVLLFFIVLSSSVSYAQDIKEEDQFFGSDKDKFITLSQVNNTLSQTEDRTSVSNGINAVFIQQIGANNVILSNINAESSDIKIIQNGDDNKVEINESSRDINKIITQTGNNNAVIDFSFNPDISTNLELIQEGNNLIFERFGSNELSKNLKFRMSGDARTVIIRSF